ncbi:MAG: ASPIC/UnbV domain-containing protein, partial [Cyclobacteriaceae bacterium]|nr:ASPIC/UnbV domain-containing protein [Cyclobacteriaceae bacterium]
RRLPESQLVGAKFWIFQKDKHQYIEYSPYRGYKSSVDRNIHVGLGTGIMVDSIVIQWPDGLIQKISEIHGDSTVELHKSGAHFLTDRSYIENLYENKSILSFDNITEEIHLEFKHEENSANDLLKTPSLIRRLSMSGPSISVGDVNMDGLDDVFVGNDRRQKPAFFVQQTDHTFSMKEMEAESQ